MPTRSIPFTPRTTGLYRLGLEHGFVSIDSEWLVFRLDEENQVADTRIVRD